MSYVLIKEARYENEIQTVGPFENKEQAERYLVQWLVNTGMALEYAQAHIDANGITTAAYCYWFSETDQPEFSTIENAIDVYCPAAVKHDFFSAELDLDWLTWDIGTHAGVECLEVLQATSNFRNVIPDSNTIFSIWVAALDQCAVICNG